MTSGLVIKSEPSIVLCSYIVVVLNETLDFFFLFLYVYPKQPHWKTHPRFSPRPPFQSSPAEVAGARRHAVLAGGVDRGAGPGPPRETLLNVLMLVLRLLVGAKIRRKCMREIREIPRKYSILLIINKLRFGGRRIPSQRRCALRARHLA